MDLKLYLVSAIALIGFVAQAKGDQPGSRAELKNALQQTEAWLTAGQNAAGWEKYLDLPTLTRELSRSGPVDVPVLIAVSNHLQSGAPGLELPAFRKLALTLDRWIDELTAPADREGLKTAIDLTQKRFHAINKADVELARAALERQIGQLETALARSPSVAAGWRKYLKLPELASQVQPGVTPDSKSLTSILEAFTADKPGLEMPEIRATAASLKSYVQLLTAAGAADLAQQYQTELSGLGEWVGKYLASPQEESASEIDRHLEWLAETHQAPALVRAIRRNLSQPNLFISAKARLLSAGIDRAIDDVSPLSDDILGTQISGSGYTRGQVRAELVPNTAGGLVDILLEGTTLSNTVGHNGPATIWSAGTTRIAGCKRILIDAGGIRTYPATAAAVTHSRTTGVQAGRHAGGLIERIARRKVAEGKGQGESIAARHAENRVRARLEDETRADLSRAQQDFVTKFRDPLVRQHLFPERFDVTTTSTALHCTVLEGQPTQLAAPSDPPALDETNLDMAVRLHESAINNLTASLLSGVTLRDADVRKKVIELRGSLPPELAEQDDQEPWSITFEKFRPVSVTLEDQGFHVVIRGHRYTVGEGDERKYGAMYVAATYKAEESPQGYRLNRQGDLDINPPQQGRQSTATVALKAILRKKFAKLFPATIESKPLELRGRWASAGPLNITRLDLGRGWAAIGWARAGDRPAQVAVLSGDSH